MAIMVVFSNQTLGDSFVIHVVFDIILGIIFIQATVFTCHLIIMVLIVLFFGFDLASSRPRFLPCLYRLFIAIANILGLILK